MNRLTHASGFLLREQSTEKITTYADRNKQKLRLEKLIEANRVDIEKSVYQLNRITGKTDMH